MCVFKEARRDNGDEAGQRARVSLYLCACSAVTEGIIA